MTEIKLALADPRVQVRALELAVERLVSTPLQGAAQILTHLRDSIEEQVKPVVEEPQDFGSIVRATCGHGLIGVLWQRSPMQGKHYWESETGAIDVWSELTDVEVLRVGIGEPSDDDPVLDQAYGNGQYAGFDQALDAAHNRIAALRASTPLVVEQRAYDKALCIVHELRP